MGYASQLAKSYSNPDTVWNSLGAVGSTSAWDPSASTLAAFDNIISSAKLGRKNEAKGSVYLPTAPSKFGVFGSNAWDRAQYLSQLSPETIVQNVSNYRDNVLSGKYMKSLRMSDLF